MDSLTFFRDNLCMDVQIRCDRFRRFNPQKHRHGYCTAEHKGPVLHCGPALWARQRLRIAHCFTSRFPCCGLQSTLLPLFKQLACLRQGSGTHGRGKKTIIANLMKIALWKMLHQSVDEHQNRQCLVPVATSFVVIFEQKTHMALVKFHDSSFCNHRALGIAARIANRTVGPLQRRPQSNMPMMRTDESKTLLHIETSCRVGTQRAAEQGRLPVHGAYRLDDVQFPLQCQQRGRYQIALGRVHPSFAVAANAAGSNDHMKMHVPFQVAAERMDNDQETRRHLRHAAAPLSPFPRFAPFGNRISSGQAQYRIRKRPKQHRHQNIPVVLYRQPQLPRQCKHQMTIFHIQHIRQQLSTPLLGAGCSATGAQRRFTAMRHNLHRRTGWTPKQMNTQCHCLAQQHLTHILENSAAYSPALEGNVASPVIACPENIRNAVFAFPCRSHAKKILHNSTCNVTNLPFTRSVGTKCLYA